jgi:hypothetical protein
MIRRRRLPMLVMAGKVMKKVITVPFRVRLPLKKNRIRAMRKLLMIVICGPSWNLVWDDRMMPNQDKMRMIMSKIRQES